MLPPYDVVDMGVGIIPLAPLIVLRSGDANVFMEVTAAHFQALFKIVQKQIGDPDTQRDIAAMPKRQGRHPKSDPHAPIDSPRGTRYFIEGRGGWNRCLKEEVSGSASSARARRRLVRIPCSSRAGKHRRYGPAKSGRQRTKFSPAQTTKVTRAILVGPQGRRTGLI